MTEMNKKYEVIDRILEVLIYLYLVFMFLSKGEAIRNILLFSGFLLWLGTLKYRENKWILKEPLSILFWVFIASIFISVIFSIDPVYSFWSLRGEPLKSVIIFSLVSTVISDENRLRKLVSLTLPVLVFTLFIGYYSYWAHDLPIMRADTPLRHTWHARFAMDINTLLPFSFVILYALSNKKAVVFLLTVIAAAVAAIVLSTSRGGAAAFISILIMWAIYVSKKRGVHMGKTLAGLLLVSVISAAVLFSSPVIMEKFSRISTDLKTLTKRTDIWGPLVSAASEKPIVGWGYGPEIFMMDEPFHNTPYKDAPVKDKPAFRNPHNAFLRVYFHQGVLGLIPYVLLIAYAVREFWRNAFRIDNMSGNALFACSTILVSIFVLNALLENTHFTDLALILGVGCAAVSIRRDRTNGSGG